MNTGFDVIQNGSDSRPSDRTFSSIIHALLTSEVLIEIGVEEGNAFGFVYFKRLEDQGALLSKEERACRDVLFASMNCLGK